MMLFGPSTQDKRRDRKLQVRALFHALNCQMDFVAYFIVDKEYDDEIWEALTFLAAQPREGGRN